MKAIKIISALLLLALTVGCLPSCSGVSQYQTVYYDLFDTVTVIQGYSDSSEEYNSTVRELHRELLTCHRLFDIYNEYDGINNLATVNKNAGGSPVEVDSRIIELLTLAKQMHDTTDGALNVAMGACLKVWHDYRTADNNTLPSDEELAAAAEHIGIDSLVIDPTASTVCLSDPESSLDVGAIAKGYACDRSYAILKDSPIVSACINIGGNIFTYGEKPSGEGAWTVGIPTADGEGRLFELEVTDRTVVTSGDYHRYFTVDGVDYHHIIDPATGYPSAYHSQVSVISESSALADALSTALFVLDLESGEVLADKYGVAVIWVEKDGTVHQNSKALEYTKRSGQE